MSSAMQTTRKGAAEVLVWCALVLGLIWAAWRVAVVGLRFWDDEGFFLLELADYFQGATLYSETNLYGPLYFQVLQALHVIVGFEATHDHSRIYSAICWAVAAVGTGIAARLWTGSLWWGLTATVLSFRLLDGLEQDLLHPSALSVVLVASWLVVIAATKLRTSWTWAFSGVITGLLMMLKINVGIYAGAAVWFALALSGLPRSIGRWVALPIVFAPLVIVRPFTDTPVFWVFGSVLSISLLGLWWHGAQRDSLEPGYFKKFTAVAVGVCGAMAFVLLLLLAGGDSITGWFQRTVIDPAQLMIQFSNFRIPVRWQWWVVILPIAGVFFPWLAARIKWPSDRVVLAVASVGIFIFALRPPIHLITSGAPFHFLQAGSLLALALAAGSLLRCTPTADRVAVLLLLAYCFLGALQMVPIAGGQLSFAVFPHALVAVLCLHHALGSQSPGSSRRWGVLAPCIFSILLAGEWLTDRLERDYLTVPLALPGAESIQVPPQDRAALHFLTSLLKEKELKLITLPAFNSLHHVSGHPPLTRALRQGHMALSLPAEEVTAIYKNAGAPSKTLFVVRKDALAGWFPGYTSLMQLASRNPALQILTEWPGSIVQAGLFTVFMPPGFTTSELYCLPEKDLLAHNRIGLRFSAPLVEGSRVDLLITPRNGGHTASGWEEPRARRVLLRRSASDPTLYLSTEPLPADSLSSLALISVVEVFEDDKSQLVPLLMLLAR